MSSPESTTGSGETTGPGQEEQSAAGTRIDLHALAARIYQLLKEEARLERERLGRRQTW
jgi:hypothetical protein